MTHVAGAGILAGTEWLRRNEREKVTHEEIS